MNQQQLNNYLESFKDFLRQIHEEVERLYSKQEEVSRREQNIVTIKDNLIEILNLLKTRDKQPIIQKEINSLNKILEITHISDVYSIIELSDSRIATGNENGYIRLYSINYEKKQWEMNGEHRGHNFSINSLCELNENRLISSSDDRTLKVWRINKNTITHIETLKGHIFPVYQVISLSNNIIASAGSGDKTIKMWDVNAYKMILSLQEDFDVCSLLKLKNRDIMVAGGNGKSVSFWNTSPFLSKEQSVPCCDCWSYHGLIELPNYCIAVNGGWSSSIDIIDTQRYLLIKQIKYNNYLVNTFGSFPSLHLLNNGTFCYSHNGTYCQFSSETYEILFKIKMKDEFKGMNVISSFNGKYIIADNNKQGISIFEIA